MPTRREWREAAARLLYHPEGRVALAVWAVVAALVAAALVWLFVYL